MFQVLDSFAIRQRNQFYLIGNVISGEVKENWFVIVPFNSGISMSIRINQVESIEIASEDEAKTLLIVNCVMMMQSIFFSIRNHFGIFTYYCQG